MALSTPVPLLVLLQHLNASPCAAEHARLLRGGAAAHSAAAPPCQLFSMPFAPLPTPRSRLGQLAVFVGGCVVIAATTVDVARRIQGNAAPPAAEQLAELQAYKQALDRQAAQGALARAAGER